MSQLQEPAIRVGVVVTFLRMDRQPTLPPQPLPPDAQVTRERWCSVAQYRMLYNTVGAPHVWWLRRMVADHQLASMLRDPRISIHVLHHHDALAGFYELDRTPWPTVNLSYFGLMPHAVGRGLGTAFLRQAVDTAWAMGPRQLTVNTCTADHPRALPTYLRAGFRPVRQAREEWNVPTRLGLDVPQELRI